MFLLAATVHFIGVTFYAVYASGELQPWAEPPDSEQKPWDPMEGAKPQWDPMESSINSPPEKVVVLLGLLSTYPLRHSFLLSRSLSQSFNQAIFVIFPPIRLYYQSLHHWVFVPFLNQTSHAPTLLSLPSTTMHYFNLKNIANLLRF